MISWVFFTIINTVKKILWALADDSFDWSIVPCTKKVAHLIPSQGSYTRQPIDVSLSCPLSKINKMYPCVKIKKKKSHECAFTHYMYTNIDKIIF